MDIVVTLKQTFDTETKISISDGKINDAGVKLVINPYDEFAIEEALKLKEEFGGEVTLVSVGGPGVETALRTGLAMGADKAVLVSNPDLTVVDEVVVAEILAKAISDLPYDIILSGRIDTDYQASQVAVALHHPQFPIPNQSKSRSRHHHHPQNLSQSRKQDVRN